MGKTWKKRTKLAVDWAQKVRIRSTIRRIPQLVDFLQATAIYWDTSVEQVTPEMMKAHLRHSCTNYEDRVAELVAIDRKHRLSPQDRYIARNLLKLSAIETADKLFSKIIRLHREKETSVVVD